MLSLGVALSIGVRMSSKNLDETNPFGVPSPVTGVSHIAGEVTAPERQPLLMVTMNKIASACREIEHAPQEAVSGEPRDIDVSGLKALIVILLRALSETDLTEQEARFAVRVLDEECLHLSISDPQTGMRYLARRKSIEKNGLVPILEKTKHEIAEHLDDGEKRRPLLAAIIRKIIAICDGIEQSLKDAQNIDRAKLANRSMIAMLSIVGRIIRESKIPNEHLRAAIQMLYTKCMCYRHESGVLAYRDGFLQIGLISVFQKVVSDLNKRLPKEQRITF